MFPRRQPVISDASLEDANRIIFSPWDTLSGYEEPVTDIIDIPSDDEGILASSALKKYESSTRLTSRIDQIASKNISVEEEKSNKSSSFSQLVIRVQTSHFHKVRINFVFVNNFKCKKP